jgi:flagellar protein FlgJ
MKPSELNSPANQPTEILRETSSKTSSAKERRDSRLQKACRDFEEIFLKMVLREAHIDRSMTGGKGASPLYGDMIRETLARALSSGGGIGLAETLYRQLASQEIESDQTEKESNAIQSHQSEGMK